MSIFVFDIYTIGIGPSSSHTVGPMRASRRFALELESRQPLDRTQRLRVILYGSLGLTGQRHGSDRAILMGLEGESPEAVDPERITSRVEEIVACRALRLMGRREIGFDRGRDPVFDRDRRLAYHPSGLHYQALDVIPSRAPPN
jgi:L-serine dehydratase